MALISGTEMPGQAGHDEDEAGHDGLGVRYDVGMTLGG